jgi:hypothetical protein
MTPDMRSQLAREPFEEKIRKVGHLIQISRTVKHSSRDALLPRLNKAAAELDAGEALPGARGREHIEPRSKPSTR